MEEISSFKSGHEDIVHDAVYDFYGKRIATCSGDQNVKIWDKEAVKAGDNSANSGENIGQDDSSIVGHRWSLNDKWKAHDGAVTRVAWAHPEFGQVIATCSFDRSIRIWEEREGEPKKNGKRWSEKARLQDSRATVQDIKFAPHYLGLKLATISADGVLRIYEATDIINLAHWTLMEDFEVGPSNSKEAGAEYCLSWCYSRFVPPMLAVGCGKEHMIKIYRYSDSARKWQNVEQLSGHLDLIHDVSWAPSIGRSYELVATACKDKRVRIFKLTMDGEERIKSELVADLKEHHAEVWRVEWNITGTTLASSGDDGRLLLWRADHMGEWKLINEFGESQPSR